MQGSPPSLSTLNDFAPTHNDSTTKRHDIAQGYTAFETRRQPYSLRISEYVSPIVNEPPRPMGSSPHTTSLSFAPITTYNEWPGRLSNSSIFPWLLEPAGSYPVFAKFIQTWYQSASAIVSYSNEGPRVIGSGCLIGNNFIAAARHNFDGVPCDKLFVRFYKYHVTRLRYSSELLINEDYLEIPVTQKINAESGQDAGYLVIPKFVNRTLFDKYACVLPVNNTFATRLPLGDYAMFHFASGHPQISVGSYHDNTGLNLYDEAAIQAGNGASGATLIWNGLNGVYGTGISIYRRIENGHVDRRVIPFAQFTNPVYLSSISSPYLYNPNFTPEPTEALSESGYEFLPYGRGFRCGIRPPKPNDPVYAVVDGNHSTHHIIPIQDLVYLWDYFRSLDGQSENEIISQAKLKASEDAKQQAKNLSDEITQFFPTERNERWPIAKQALQQYKQGVYEVQCETLKASKLKEKYGQFHSLLNSLCPTGNITPTGFAWSHWNLFKGWNEKYRADDPGDDDPRNRSEKNCPQSFNENLWSCLKDCENGLFKQIQDLKKTKEPNVQYNKVLESLYTCLIKLQTIWSQELRRRQKAGEEIIHPFKKDEWEKTDIRKEGHETYRVSSTCYFDSKIDNDYGIHYIPLRGVC